MRILSALLFLSIALPPSAALAKKAVTDYPATYAGGSLPLSHHKVRAALAKDEIIFMQGNRRIAVPVKNITEISCGRARYIGMAWSGANGNTERAEVLLKLNRGEYGEFLAALEQSTGIKAVNTNQVPTVVRYKI
jgi:hypothetical protein